MITNGRRILYEQVIVGLVDAMNQFCISDNMEYREIHRLNNLLKHLGIVFLLDGDYPKEEYDSNDY